jgi:hypothetical protein
VTGARPACRPRLPWYVYEAVAGTDGTINRTEVVTMVERYVAGEPLDGVELTRTQVVTLVHYYVRQ